MKLCACLTEKTAEDCIRVAKTSDAPLLEHRIDYMDEIKDLSTIYASIKTPVISTVRPLKCGGHFTGEEEKRINILMEAIGAGCAMIDIEIDTKNNLKQKIIKKAREADVQVIISMHDFEKTPPPEELIEIMYREKEEGADVGKIVTMANSAEDCHNMLGLLLEARKIGFPLVAFAMGKVGIFTRVASLFYGAPFTYVSFGKKSAPGQLDINSTKMILKELGA
ncbi:MAG: type I 3-dehydroquinate dehydratase [Candidatus Methanofastidiosia archaeon]